MRITALVENISACESCTPVHGLSLWIETSRTKLLMDAGPSDVLISNAAALGVDLAQADALILSHGHYDHAGGILSFAAMCPDVPIYLRRSAEDRFFSISQQDGSCKYIGIDPSIALLPQVRRVDGVLEIGDQLTLFGDIAGRRCWPESNLRLKRGEDRRQDPFDHEQCLVIRENGFSVLVSGCAHNGILNILDRYQQLFASLPDAVISGFHMKKTSPYTAAEKETIRQTAHELKKLPCRFHTCHCTGMEAYEMMKEIMGGQLGYLRCGEMLQLP